MIGKITQQPGALHPNNALAPFAAPTLDQEMRRLVGAYGREAVRAAARAATAGKRGRKPDPDWKLLRPIIEEDAELWLNGQEAALRERTNYKIAQAFAAEYPGHSAPATFRRIMRKLAKSRELFVLVSAMEKSHSNYPVAAYVRALEALVDTGAAEFWSSMLARARGEIERYRDREGDADPALSFAGIEEANRNAPALLPSFLGLSGLLGMFGNPRQQ